jgi:hypothetical protein
MLIEQITASTWGILIVAPLESAVFQNEMAISCALAYVVNTYKLILL